MVSSKLLLFFLEAACSGHKPAFEMLLFDGILWHDEFVVVEACLVFGGRHIIVVLDLPVCRFLMRVGSFVLLRWILLEGIVFGTVRGVIVSGAGIAVLAVAGFRVAPLTLALRLFLEGVILRCSIAIPFFWGVHHVYVI